MTPAVSLFPYRGDWLQVDSENHKISKITLIWKLFLPVLLTASFCIVPTWLLQCTGKPACLLQHYNCYLTGCLACTYAKCSHPSGFPSKYLLFFCAPRELLMTAYDTEWNLSFCTRPWSQLELSSGWLNSITNGPFALRSSFCNSEGYLAFRGVILSGNTSIACVGTQ